MNQRDRFRWWAARLPLGHVFFTLGWNSCSLFDGLSLHEIQERGQLISIKDMLGRDVSNYENNEIRLYLYSDGRVEKKITKLK